MKKHTRSSIATNAFFGSLTLAFLLMGTATTNAQSVGTATKTTETVPQDKVQIKYLASSDDGVLFSVKYINTGATAFNLSVTDEDGEVLYENSFTDKLFEKKFKLSRGLDKVKFVIRNEQQKFEQSFAVNINTRLVEDFAVNRN